MEPDKGMLDGGRQNRFTPGKFGQGVAVSWPGSSPIAKRTLTHDGVKYRVRIYGKGRHGQRRYIAMAKVDGKLVVAPAATDEARAQAEFIKLVDPEVEFVRDTRGRVLA